MEDQQIKEPINTGRGSAVTRTSLLVIILLLAVVGFGWSYFRYQSSEQGTVEGAGTQDLVTLREKENAEILESVRVLTDIPENELPIIATVDDAESLAASQDFFANVERGDKLIIFTKRAVIYRQETNTIVAAGTIIRTTDGTNAIETIAVDAGQNEKGPEEEQAVPPGNPGEGITVEIRNGTQVSGLAGRTRTELEEEGYEVRSIGNASQNTYEATVIVSLRDANTSDLESRFTTIAVNALPAGEQASTADIVIILGGDQ